MPPLVSDLLPASLASRLNEAQLQALAETPRDKRLEVLATALAIPEAAALTLVADAAGLITASNLEADTEARSLLPARLVHDYQIIPIKWKAEGSSSELSDSQLSAPNSQLLPQPLHLATAWLPDDIMADWLRTFTPR